MKSIHLVALLGTAATFVFAGCEKKPARSMPHASGTPETANAAPREKMEAEGEIAASPAPGSPASPQPGPPAGGDAFSSEAARILELPAGSERDQELEKFVRASMHGGFERTDEWIRKMPAGPTRDIAYSAFIEDLANVAPMLALDYTRHISDPEKRVSLEAMLQAKPSSIRPSKPGPGDAPENPQPIPGESDDSGMPATR